MHQKSKARAADPSRLRLVDAATRLFAEHGIDGVALKDIVAAAGQKNQSAVQYYFGDKGGLIAAALENRFRSIDARRAASVAAAMTLSGKARRHAVMRATVEPIVAEAESHAGGPAYVRFVAQAIQRPEFNAAALITEGEYPGLAALNAAVAADRGFRLTRAEAAQRIRICASVTMTAVADWVAHGFGPLPRETLIGMVAGANEAVLLN
jgi:AcrR family transcriptional regulator